MSLSHPNAEKVPLDPVEIEALFSKTLNLEPSALEFSSFCPSYFVICTYQLEENAEVKQKELKPEPEDTKIKQEDPEIKQEPDNDEEDFSDKIAIFENQGENPKVIDMKSTEIGQRVHSPEEDNGLSDDHKLAVSAAPDMCHRTLHHYNGMQKKSGSLVLCRVGVKLTDGEELKLEVEIVEELFQPSAVYDLAFQDNLLAVGTATGSISLFEILPPTVHKIEAEFPTKQWHAQLVYMKTFQLSEISTMVVSLQWSPINNVFAMGCSDGKVHIAMLKCENGSDSYDLGLSAVLQEHMSEITHMSEATYCVAWGQKEEMMAPCFEKGPLENHIFSLMNVFSGGDDGYLRCTQVSIAHGLYEVDKSDSAAFKLVKYGGVTAIAHIRTERIIERTDYLLTGGHDNYVQIISVTSEPPPLGQTHKAVKPERFVVLTKLDLGGTVYKLEIVKEMSQDGPATHRIVLATCASAGVQMLRVSEEWGIFSITVVGKLSHELNYASGFKFAHHFRNSEDTELQRFLGNENMGIGISTSYYDRLLCAWTFDIDRLADY